MKVSLHISLFQFSMASLLYTGMIYCEMYWKTPVHSTEEDHFGYHPYVLLTHEISEILEHNTTLICEQNEDRICMFNDKGEIIEIKFPSEDPMLQISEIFKILSFHSETFLRAMLKITDKTAAPFLYPTKLTLHIDHYGEHKRPLLSSNTHITGILIVSAPDLGADGNMLSLLDPRTQPANSVFGNSPSSKLYDLEEGRVLVFPSYLRWHLLPNNDMYSSRIYFLIEFSMVSDKISFCYTLQNQFISAEYNSHHYYTARNTSLYVDWIWGTPIEQYHNPILAGLKERMVDYVLKEENEEGVVKSNRGGWQSNANQLTGSNKILKIIKQEVRSVVTNFSINQLGNDQLEENIHIPHLWFGINRNLDSNVIHVHPGTHISGVYYIDSGLENGRACINYVDPRPQASVLFGEIAKDMGLMKICVEAGNFVLFPSWLEHFVDPLMNLKRPRIIFSFNAILE